MLFFCSLVCDGKIRYNQLDTPVHRNVYNKAEGEGALCTPSVNFQNYVI